MAGTENHTWSELAIDLYDKLTGRNAEITYELQDVEVGVPSHVSHDANMAPWRVSGTIKIRTRDLTQAV